MVHLLEFWVFYKHLIKGGDVGHVGWMVFKHFIANVVSVSRIGDQDLCPAHVNGALTHGQPGNVKKRESRQQNTFIPSPAQPGNDAQDIVATIPVGEHGALGIPGGAARILNPSQIIRC